MVAVSKFNGRNERIQPFRMGIMNIARPTSLLLLGRRAGHVFSGLCDYLAVWSLCVGLLWQTALETPWAPGLDWMK